MWNLEKASNWHFSSKNLLEANDQVVAYIGELYSQAKFCLPIRSSFETYLEQGLSSKEGYIIITDPEPDEPGGKMGWKLY